MRDYIGRNFVYYDSQGNSIYGEVMYQDGDEVLGYVHDWDTFNYLMALNVYALNTICILPCTSQSKNILSDTDIVEYKGSIISFATYKMLRERISSNELVLAHCF